jgi:SEC-C motif-containing protein
LKRISINTLCPCGSKIKYKKCCNKFHKGLKPSSALELMRSRYCAYSIGDAKYIINTTHPDNSDFIIDKKEWAKSIMDFCNSTEFLSLEILEVEDKRDEAFVTFKASFSDSYMIEKSRFLKVDNNWLYESGIFKI